jgi:hypothetical protein
MCSGENQRPKFSVDFYFFKRTNQSSGLWCPPKLICIETPETETETSFGTIQNKMFVSVVLL